MKIIVKRLSQYQEVKIVDGSTTIELGLLNDKERDELAKELLEGVYAMGPKYHVACSEWFVDLLAKCGIELPDAHALPEPLGDRQGRVVGGKVAK